MGMIQKGQARPWDGTRIKITPGDYVFELTESKDDFTKDSLAKSIVSLKIVGEWKNGAIKPSKYDNQVIKGNYVHAGDAVGRTLQLAAALGVNIPEGDEEFDFDPANFVGHKIIAYVENNPDKNDANKVYNNLVNERRMPTAKQQAATADEIAKLKGKKADQAAG